MMDAYCHSIISVCMNAFLLAALFLDGFTQPDDNTLMANVANGITQHVDHNQITNRGDSLFICFPYFILSKLHAKL